MATFMTFARNRGGLIAAGLASVFLAFALSCPTQAQAREITIAQQYGVGYLPLMVMRQKGLVVKHAEALGLKDTSVKWSTFTGGADMNTALLSGHLDVSSQGVGPFLKIWSATKGLYDARAMASINNMPLFLNTTNPDVHDITQFTEKDRIALPAVKVSIQAITLQMAAAKAFGMENYDKLDNLTVTMSHPDGMIALLSGKSRITGHLTSPPFQYQELMEDPKVHTVLNSYDVLGGPSTFNVVVTTKKFRDQHPKEYKAVFSALVEAIGMINKDKHWAAQVYLDQTHSKLPLSLIEKIISEPEISYTVYPQGVMKYAKFMHETGSIKHMPASVEETFFPEVFELKK